MTSRTITLPTGVKFRCASQRRYILVATLLGNAVIVRRSDTLATIEKEYARRNAGDVVIAGSTRQLFIVDTTTGETITSPSDLVGDYRPNMPGARSLADARPMIIGTDWVTASIYVHPTTGIVCLSVFIGLRSLFDGPVPDDIKTRGDVNPAVARMALQSA